MKELNANISLLRVVTERSWWRDKPWQIGIMVSPILPKKYHLLWTESITCCTETVDVKCTTVWWNCADVSADEERRQYIVIQAEGSRRGVANVQG